MQLMIYCNFDWRPW